MLRIRKREAPPIHDMAALLVNMILFFFLIKPVILDKGYVSEVKINTKVQCASSSTEVFTVKSEMQCAHQCLRKKCNLLNYNAERGKEDNCEVLRKVGKCTEFFHQFGWKLMTFVVKEVNAYIFSMLDILYNEQIG